MRPAERARSLLARPRLLIAAAIVVQWLTTLIVALRAETVDIDAFVLVNVLLLGPLALFCAFRIAASAGGVALGAWTLLVWVAWPWLAPVFTLASYDTTLRDHVLPLALGLTDDNGYAEGIAILAAVALVIRRTRIATASGALLLAGLLAVWLSRIGSAGGVSADAFQANMAGLREYFWSQRLLQWLPLAGVIAVARRSLPLALLLGGWLGICVALRATQAEIGFENADLFRALLPALPAYILLAAGIPLLVPTLATRLGPLASPAARP